MNDPLGAALDGSIKKSNKKLKNISSKQQTVETDNDGCLSPPSTAKRDISRKTTKRTKQSGRKNNKCCFCNNHRAVVSITKSLTKKSYCLLHYYTTKACRVSTDRIQKMEIGGDNDIEDNGGARLSKDDWNIQLPYMQTLFDEAFSELQSDILTESARSFHSMAERGNDPLSILTEDRTLAKKKRVRGAKTKSRAVNNEENNVDADIDGGDGGFLQQVHSKELKLMHDQERRIERAAKKSISNILVKQNPYKRRKTSSKSSWHLVLNRKDKSKSSNDGTLTEKMDFMSTSVLGITCSCGSQDIELCGNVTSRNNEVSKADTWGFKREHDVSTIVRCTNCNKTWKEED